MLTTRLQTICASVATTRCHQMRVAGRAWGRRDARSDVQKAQTEAGCRVLGLIPGEPGLGLVGGGLHSEVQGIMGNGHMGTPPVDRQSDRRTL